MKEMISIDIDNREHQLIQDIQSECPEFVINVKQLTIGDLIIYKENEDGERNPLLLIERKTVKDLVQSLRDGRHHDQRRRWKEFQNDCPKVRVSLWLEGDLLTAGGIDDKMRGSLLNSLFRMQSIHNVIVHQIRTRSSFLHSLKFIVEKFSKDPEHLLPSDEDNGIIPNTIIDMKQYKKTKDVSDETAFWRCCLSLVPGISSTTALKIVAVFPTLLGFMEQLKKDEKELLTLLSNIQISEKRKLGMNAATKITKCFVASEVK